MNKAWSSLAVLPLLTCFLQAASPVVSEIPLPEKSHPGLETILRSAVQQSPRMVNRALELEIAENDRIAARANLLPSLSASYGYNRATDKYGTAIGNSSIKTPYSLVLSQPLFHWGERWNNNKIGKIQEKIAQGQYREGYRMLAQQLRRDYLRLIVQKQSVTRALFYKQYMGNQLKLQEDRYSKKLISESEIVFARVNDEQAEIGMEQTQLDYASAKQAFVRLAGLNSLDDEAIPDSVAEQTYSSVPYEQLLAEFLAQKDPNSVAAFNLRQQLDIANLSYANAKTRLRPKVNAVFGLTQDEQTNFAGSGNKYSVASRYAGISINWTIFDGFAAGAATRNSLARRRILENDYHELTGQLAQAAQSAEKQINFSARLMAINDRALASSKGYFRTVQEDFRRGIKSETDVGQVQLNVYDTEIITSNARADYLMKIGEFLATLNEDPIVANIPGKE